MEIRLTDIDMLHEFRLPSYTEIPDVGLYLKQVVKYINDSAGQCFGFKVTESMLSNYVKMHMVANPIKKQYYREHIAALLFISMAKPVLSLEEIDAVLKLQKEKYTVSAAYSYYKSYFETALYAVYGNKSIELKEKEASDEQKLLQNIVIAMSYKYYLDSCFQD